MPVTVKKVRDKFRLIEPNGNVAKNASGTAIDGGGHKTKTKAQRQAAAVNSKERK